MCVQDYAENTLLLYPEIFKGLSKLKGTVSCPTVCILTVELTTRCPMASGSIFTFKVYGDKGRSVTTV